MVAFWLQGSIPPVKITVFLIRRQQAVTRLSWWAGNAVVAPLFICQMPFYVAQLNAEKSKSQKMKIILRKCIFSNWKINYMTTWKQQEMDQSAMTMRSSTVHIFRRQYFKQTKRYTVTNKQRTSVCMVDYMEWCTWQTKLTGDCTLDSSSRSTMLFERNAESVSPALLHSDNKSSGHLSTRLPDNRLSSINSRPATYILTTMTQFTPRHSNMDGDMQWPCICHKKTL